MSSKERLRRGPSFTDRASYALSRARGVSITADLRPYHTIIAEIQSCDSTAWSDAEMVEVARATALKLAASDAGGPVTDEHFAKLCSVFVEACRRAPGLTPYDEQLIAGLVMARGKLAEMKTGEGKTLAAVLPAYVHGWTGRGVHIITANEYLARRDATWMAPVYNRLGLSVAYVEERMSTLERRAAYAADVTYLTAKQGGFDFLRDRLCVSSHHLVQRELDTAILDEADLILIDEGRVPLVIATPDVAAEHDAVAADRLARSLVRGRDFTIDRTGRICGLTASGWDSVSDSPDAVAASGGSTAPVFPAAVHVAFHAHHLLRRDMEYIVRDGRIELVDDTTGRVVEKREWPYGIQRALEVKEGLAVRPAGRVAGTIMTRDYLRSYARVSAMTATAVPAAAEFFREHALATVVIPPHRADRTVHHPDRVFRTAAAKNEAIVRDVQEKHRTGRPILIGTRSVRESVELRDRLRDAGVPCVILNAADDADEARIIAHAGTLSAVTVSTNMAGRGTDIKLGGEHGIERDRVVALGGLYVIGTNRHESRRVDNQLRGRAGRQGDPGETRFYISLEDELITRYAIQDLFPVRYERLTEHGEIDDARVRREIERAQEIIEEQHATMRRTLREYGEIIEKERAMKDRMRMTAVLTGELPPEVESGCTPGELAASEAPVASAAVRVFLNELDEFWAEHLAFAENVREGVHLQRLGGRDPLLFYITAVSDHFARGLAGVYERTARRIEDLGTNGAPDDSGAVGAPSSTWTYTISDDPFPAFKLSLVSFGDPAGAIVNAVLAAVRLISAVLGRVFSGVRRR